MRIFLAKRIFMNEADGGSGNGAQPPPPAPAAPTAAPTAPEPPAASIVDQVANLIDTKLKAFENGFFANARRAGVLDKGKPASDPTPPPTPTPSAPAVAQAGLTMADVETLLERKGAVSSRAATHGLTAAQTKRFEAAMASVPRESLDAEADSYLADLGLVKAATPPPQPATQQPATTAPAKPNVSDRGTAAPTDLRDTHGVLNSRPLEMNGHDVDALVLKEGEAKGMQMFQERVLHALRGVRIKPPRG